MDLVFSLQPTFAARAFSGNIKQLTKIIRKGLNHEGFSFIEVLQDCPTYNNETPHNWYLDRIYDVNQLKDYDSSNCSLAKEKAKDLTENIATGILYQTEPQRNFKLSDRTNIEEKDRSITDLLNSFK
jgi:2-oxoglutarate ferredoxin oxidoreductase subunit beta